ncbi:hypothetical protein FA13DRAFT_1795693 [Coprinellus micaceus]|uniref:Fungal-type protein kinase domain-containing protein n=1 Tax=Coprinellus micaceus TaxID=71717 RepID=A0A4Y7SXD9_COPMI|nr:hypothetical protein FA13DRAFT_1795693 [Coprinellus micaceus]
MAAFVRRIFRTQPNRVHVRSLVITEKHVRLVHFDRAGPQITPPIDIHLHPDTFVRLLAGLTSISERTLGLDDSIQWTIMDGRKGQGTLTATDSNGERKTYPILEHLPIPRDRMFGRGTTCWRVQDPDTSEELVDSDSSDDEILRATGRVFTSPLQFLCALCDAIAGHRRLVDDDLRVLHRDISQNNILLGRDDVPEGERGVVIDFDLAFRVTEEQPVITAGNHIQHDYLDDLESFFYVLVYIFLVFRPDGSLASGKGEGPAMVYKWTAECPEAAASGKRGLFGYGDDAETACEVVEKYWGPVCFALFEQFRRWVKRVTREKFTLLLHRKHRREGVPSLATLHAQRDEHYAEVLKVFDHAIDAVRAAAVAHPPVATPTAPSIGTALLHQNPSLNLADLPASAISASLRKSTLLQYLISPDRRSLHAHPRLLRLPRPVDPLASSSAGWKAPMNTLTRHSPMPGAL